MPIPERAWMVRSAYLDNPEDVWTHGAVVVGWFWMGDLRSLTTREAMRVRYEQRDPDASSAQRIVVNAGQLYRFTHEIAPGHYVLSYLKGSREILIGVADGPYQYTTKLFGETWPQVRRVKWLKRVSRDDFSQAAKNSLGSTLSVFSVDNHLNEVHAIATGLPPDVVEEDEEAEEVPFHDQVKAQADELISDLVSGLDGYQFQDLVAGLLRAMGFQAVSVPPGPDRGIDIVAHPDSFGFEKPRIKVQVKHRKGAATGPEMRSFIGSLSFGDNGLFVSTGGFTKDAAIDATGAREPIKLLDRDGFIRLLTEHYERLEPVFQAQVPLQRIWVPAK